MKKITLYFLLLFFSPALYSQWTATNLGIGKNISDIYYFSPSESYLLCGNSVLKSATSGNAWSEILFDSSWQFVYLYRYNNDSILLNSSYTKYLDSQKIFRYYNNKGFKLIRSYGYSVFERNVLMFTNDTFLNISNDIGGGRLCISVEPKSFSADIIPNSPVFLHFVYYAYYLKLQSFQLLGDTLIMVSNRIDQPREEYHPIISRNNIYSWFSDTGSQAEMTNLPPCRGLWAFTADSMILLGENYIANIPHYPTLQSMQYFPNYSFEKIIFTAKDTGFIIGRNTITNRGLILRTTDGGRTWKEQQLISCPPINDIVAITSRTLLAACNEGVLLRTETAGSNPAGIEPGQQSIYASVYPNPIKQGSVNISIPGQTFAYEVYTTLGQLLASGTGNGDQKINCESWPAGIYYITLLIEDQLVSKKIQILK